MQRSLSAVVLASVGALLPAVALAQTPTKPAPAATAAPGKPAGAAKPAAAAKPASAAVKPTGSEAQPSKPDGRLSDEAELARVVGLYEAGKYPDCSSELERLLDPLGKAPLRLPAIVENARVYWAACLLGAGQTDAADAPLRAAIHENPQMKPPDSLIFPQPVVQRFLQVRDSLVTEIRAAEQARIRQAQAEARLREQGLQRDRDRMKALEKLAQQESLVVRNRRDLSFVPFGVGQIQNRQVVLGYTLMIGEGLLAGLSITAVVLQSRIAAEADRQRRQGLAVNDADVNQKLADWGTARDISFWGFAAVVVGGVLQAQLEYVPEFKETRPRPLPPELAPPAPPKKSSAVVYAPYFDTTGGGLNVMGRF